MPPSCLQPPATCNSYYLTSLEGAWPGQAAEAGPAFGAIDVPSGTGGQDAAAGGGTADFPAGAALVDDQQPTPAPAAFGAGAGGGTSGGTDSSTSSTAEDVGETAPGIDSPPEAEAAPGAAAASPSRSPGGEGEPGAEDRPSPGVGSGGGGTGGAAAAIPPPGAAAELQPQPQPAGGFNPGQERVENGVALLRAIAKGLGDIVLTGEVEGMAVQQPRVRAASACQHITRGGQNRQGAALATRHGRAHSCPALLCYRRRCPATLALAGSGTASTAVPVAILLLYCSCSTVV